MVKPIHFRNKGSLLEAHESYTNINDKDREDFKLFHRKLGSQVSNTVHGADIRGLPVQAQALRRMMA